MGMQLPRVILSTTIPTFSYKIFKSWSPHKEKTEVIKSIEAMIESQEQNLKMTDSQFQQDFLIQDSYSIF